MKRLTSTEARKRAERRSTGWYQNLGKPNKATHGTWAETFAKREAARAARQSNPPPAP